MSALLSDPVQTFELFVPGRVCLLGEHSDWAGGFRKGDHLEAIHQGQCLAYGTDVGIHATVTAVAGTDAEDLREPTEFRYSTTATALNGEAETRWSLFDEATLKAVAAEGGYFAYIAGTVAVMAGRLREVAAAGHGAALPHFRSIHIRNHTVTMPMKKGLSSSAAICVLIVRAFNTLYRMNMTTSDVMDAAYQGERCTPSMCGRMDQCCAFGSRFVSMTFDGDKVEATPVPCPTKLFFVVADLAATKDTSLILSSLSEAYPVPASPVHHNVHRFLGSLSWNFVEQAKACIAVGDAAGLGRVFDEAQREFDAHLGPACPQELTAPRLHAVLDHVTVRAHVLGGKGVGSQGDGSVQFICADEVQQGLAADALRALGCHPFTFAVGGGDQ